MTPLPLDEIRFGWRSQLSALWWLGLLYRRPHHFREALASLTRARQVAAGAVLYLHALREPLARTLRAEIEAFQGRVAGLREPLASKFRKAAEKWLVVANRQWDEAMRIFELYEHFEETSRDVPKQHYGVHSAYVQRELHPLVMCSPFVHRICVCAPRKRCFRWRRRAGRPRCFVTRRG